MNRIQTSRLRGTVLGLALLCAAATDAADDDRFERARAAFDEAAASRDGEHEGYDRAFALWHQLATEGDTRARYHIGILHMYGLGKAEFDQQLAVQNVRAAAEGGYPVAQSLMGFLVERSDGTLVVTGDEAALNWWRKGAEGNHCVAVRRMQQAYEQGELGLAADPAKASEWAARRETCDRN